LGKIKELFSESGASSLMRWGTALALLVAIGLAVWAFIVWSKSVLLTGNYTDPPLESALGPVATLIPKALQKFGERNDDI